jgi:hypothetical protein
MGLAAPVSPSKLMKVELSHDNEMDNPAAERGLLISMDSAPRILSAPLPEHIADYHINRTREPQPRELVALPTHLT